ncbi:MULTISPECIES: hypothetical protein [Tatumella]|uniref:Uncharacterized protein n=1 Tax=Tatumella punctata TaxID=399969 RepID=A0ABW1VRS8_9GAMM|nr:MULTISPECIES: hypothetical protein [unclassified Tatumella]MBS0856123.1 hypothetical protein [Tatumella sp. JGM16]MBS0877465.1 hypothetical protein [Tatumella sp. JGM82]MBS0890993.1 hypothetical protein [Tatumella sp. JGM94]MBS0894184.1 hypothetical protein [Tatumella sp. JGM130]MBS0902007.1 hypothetical protein [Tatumella sp. JGM100]
MHKSYLLHTRREDVFNENNCVVNIPEPSGNQMPDTGDIVISGRAIKLPVWLKAGTLAG